MCSFCDRTGTRERHARGREVKLQMAKTTMDMVAFAKSRVTNLSPDQVAKEIEAGATLIDLREPGERIEHGTIPTAISAPRGMLEFWADPTSPYHRSEFDATRRIVLYCASGGRSALGALTLIALGYSDVAHLEGGFKAWKESGHVIDSGT